MRSDKHSYPQFLLHTFSVSDLVTFDIDNMYMYPAQHPPAHSTCMATLPSPCDLSTPVHHYDFMLFFVLMSLPILLCLH